MSTLICIDGRFVPAEEASISVYDHGLLYGDGVYEGLRCYDGYIFQLREHMLRLKRSAKSLKIELPYSLDEMERLMVETIRKNNLLNAYVRVLLTRGKGAIGPDPRTCAKPCLIIIVEDLPNVHGEEAKNKGLSLITASIRRDPVDATSHEIKSLNYLNSVMAKMEAINQNADDAILLDKNGMVSESTICNLFIVEERTLSTPRSSNGILTGITRNCVIDIAKNDLHLQVRERDITPYEMLHADEVFLTGTHAEIVGVTSINTIPVADGKVGPVTKEIISAFRSRTGNPKYGKAVYDEKMKGAFV